MELENKNGNVFSVENVYRNVTEPLQHLEDEDYVNTSLQGMENIDQWVENFKMQLYQDLEGKQANVLENKDKLMHDWIQTAEKARKDGDFEAYQEALAGVGELSVDAIENTKKLQYLQNKGHGSYNSEDTRLVIVKGLERKLLSKGSNLLEEKCRS
jgi:hypothetical protein